MNVGAHLDNVDNPPASSYRRIGLMRATVVLTLWTGGTKHRAAVYTELRKIGVQRVCVRVGDETIPGSVADYLNDVDHAVNAAVAGGFDETAVDVQILNEVNLREGVAPAGAFVGSVQRAWRRRARPVLTPLSRGVTGWRDYLAAFVAAMGDLDEAHLWAWGEHVYADDAEHIAPADGRAMVVTEFSHPTLTGEERGRWVKDRLTDFAAKGYEYACQFIVDGQDPTHDWPDNYVMTDTEAEVIGLWRPVSAPDLPATPAPPPKPAPKPSQEKPMIPDWCPFATRKPIPVNYWPGRDGHEIAAIVDHIADGAGSLFGWFSNPAAEASAHFWVSKAGAIEQYRPLSDACWANGPLKNPNVGVPLIANCQRTGVNPNRVTVAIEHEGKPGDAFPAAQIATSRRLHHWLSEALRVPLDRTHVLGHYQFDSVTRARCPGETFPWEAILMPDPTPTPQPSTDASKLRDQAWALAEQFEKAGQPWTGQGIKALVALGKGEK